MSALLSLLSYDALGFPAELVLAAALLMVPEKRRPHFVARAAIAFLSCLAVALASAGLLDQGWLNLLRYLLVFCTAMACLPLCWELSRAETIFFGAAAYSIQHCVWRLKIALGILFRAPVIGTDSLGWPSTLLLTVALAAGFRHALRPNRDETVGSRQLVAVTAIVLGADLVLSYVPFADGSTVRLDASEAVASVYATICCLLVLALQSGMLTQSRLRHEQETLRELWALDKRQYEQTKRSIDLINARSHDLKKQVGALLAMGRADDETTRALEETRRSIESYEHRAQTGSDALDALLTQKLMQADAQETTLTYLVDGADFDCLGAVDLYALFGNALDNALEATARIPERERRIINLKATRRQGLLIMRCENYMAAAPQVAPDGQMVSSKEDRDNHGFGLRSIRLVVERHGGHVTLQADGDVFRVQAVMPAK